MKCRSGLQAWTTTQTFVFCLCRLVARKRSANRKPPKAKASQPKPAPAEPKMLVYRCPDGTEWNGRGRRPQVLVNYLKVGASLEDYATWRTAKQSKK